MYEFNSSLYNKKILSTMFSTIPLIIQIFIMKNMWYYNTTISSMMSELMIIMNNQCKRSMSNFIKGFSIILVSLFLVLASVNLMGLLSMSFSLSSHLMFTLIIGLPLWMSLMFSSFMFSKNKFIAHLLPDGAPLWLNPFLVLIETVSILVRPLTLSFRLAANMTAGHVVLCLVSSFLSMYLNSFKFNHFIFLMLTSMYMLFEVAICIIQAYIFCLLLSLYTDDHS